MKVTEVASITVRLSLSVHCRLILPAFQMLAEIQANRVQYGHTRTEQPGNFSVFLTLEVA
jgi:hypothetical protein